MRKTWKIARACFVGGVVCCGVALFVAPAFWWLGIIAGFATGYLGYEFREVQVAAPKALAASSEVTSEVIQGMRDAFKDFLATPHPFGYPATVAGVSLFSWMMWGTNIFSYGILAGFFTLLLAFIICCMAAAILVYLPLSSLGLLGARFENHYWMTADLENSWNLERLQKNGLSEAPLTYSNAYRWALGGLRVILYVAFIWIWVQLFRFVLALIRLIHSDERVLCGVDGTLGGLITLWAFSQYGPADTSLPAMVFVSLCGGVVCALLGVFNWELVSKRVYGFGKA